MMLKLSSISRFLNVFAFGVGVLFMTMVAAVADQVRAIVVEGNQRLDSATIRSYLTISPGIPFTEFDTDESLQALYATGLFADVSIVQEDGRLIVKVIENPTINIVRFEGNENVKDEILRSVIQLESLGIFDRDKLASDEQRVQEAMRRSGRSEAVVSSRIDELENNRVDVIFKIEEGGRTRITSIEFKGNNSFTDRTLRDVITHRENNIFSWLRRDDIFDNERLEADEERLRQYYFNKGFADFEILESDAKLDSESNTYSIVISMKEGIQYRFGKISVDSALSVAPSEVLQQELKIETGDLYSSATVDSTLEQLTEFIAQTGYAFAEITPRGERNESKQIIDITFFVDEGPRMYIERIEIIGNDRSRDYVVRREFDISEGDPYNTVLINKAKNRLDALGFFSSVRIDTREGSQPGRVVVEVHIVDQATGELSFGGGYSTANGIIGEASLKEKNFLGRGHSVQVTGGFGSDTQTYELGFTEPYFLGQRIAAGFDIRTQTVDADNRLIFDTNTTLVRLRAAIELGEQVIFNTNYSYQYDKLQPTMAANAASIQTADLIDRTPFVVSSVGYGLIFSDLDDVNSPRNGYRVELNQDIAGVGGDAEYISTTSRVKGYYLLSPEHDLVLSGELGLGVIEPLGNDLRIVDHFFQGGETTRGFSTNGFGPSDAGGSPIGGTKYINASLEFEFPFPFVSRNLGLRGAAFLDAGTLYDNNFNLKRALAKSTEDNQQGIITSNAGVEDKLKIRASTGLSIIWDSPFGPLRGDFTHVITEEEGDDTQTFRFGINSRF